MYSVSIRNMANSAVPRVNPAMLAAVSVRSRKIENGMSGSFTRDSHAMNAASSTPAAREDADRRGRAPTPVPALRDTEDEGRETAVTRIAPSASKP